MMLDQRRSGAISAGSSVVKLSSLRSGDLIVMLDPTTASPPQSSLNT